jgi:hypothetical protein
MKPLEEHPLDLPLDARPDQRVGRNHHALLRAEIVERHLVGGVHPRQRRGAG